MCVSVCQTVSQCMGVREFEFECECACECECEYGECGECGELCVRACVCVCVS